MPLVTQQHLFGADTGEQRLFDKEELGKERLLVSVSVSSYLFRAKVCVCGHWVGALGHQRILEFPIPQELPRKNCLKIRKSTAA